MSTLNHYVLPAKAYVEIYTFLRDAPLPVPHSFTAKVNGYMEEAQQCEENVQEKLDQARQELGQIQAALSDAKSRLRDFQQALQDAKLELPEVGYFQKRKVAHAAERARAMLAEGANAYEGAETTTEEGA